MRPRILFPRLSKDLSSDLRPSLWHRRSDLQQRMFPGDRDVSLTKPSCQKVPRHLRPADRGTEKLFILTAIQKVELARTDRIFKNKKSFLKNETEQVVKINFARRLTIHKTMELIEKKIK